MSERMEWRVVCADGAFAFGARSQLQAESIAQDADTDSIGCRCGGPHRVQSRTVSTSEWADTESEVSA